MPTFAVAEETEEPLLLGRSNPIVFGVGAFLLFAVAGVMVFLLRRRILWLVFLDLLGIAAGQIATTGTYTGLNFAKPGSTVRAIFSGFGSAEVRFTS